MRHRLHRFKQVVRSVQAQGSHFYQRLNHPQVIFRVCIQTGAGSCSADSQPAQPFGGLLNSINIALYRARVCAKFLAQTDGNRILQISTSGFDNRVEFNRFILQCLSQTGRGIGQFIQPPKAAQADGCGNDIIGGLSHVYMIIRADQISACLPAKQLSGAIGDDFVGVHVMAGPCACLKWINDKLIVEIAQHDFFPGLDNDFGQAFV